MVERQDNFDSNTLSTISDGTDFSKDRVTNSEWDVSNRLTDLDEYRASTTTLTIFTDNLKLPE